MNIHITAPNYAGTQANHSAPLPRVFITSPREANRKAYLRTTLHAKDLIFPYLNVLHLLILIDLQTRPFKVSKMTIYEI